MGSGSSLEHHDLSHVGRRRANNQDSRGVVEPWNREQYRRRGWLFVVADGMGAHAAGEEASAMAVREVTAAYEKHVSLSPPLALEKSIREANKKIHDRGDTSPDLKGMGTTCTALVLLPRGVLVGHVGDSRAYRVRDGRIEQLTRDHSLVWELEAKTGGADAGLPAGVPKNIITRSMGPHAEVQVDLEGPFPVEPDDVYVLCSDGLSGQVGDAEIGLLAATLPAKTAAEALVGLALVRGAPDNVTVVVARAGDREKSKFSRSDQPWLVEMPDADADANRRPVLPWRWLVAAAVSLLGALICAGFLEVQDPTPLLDRALEKPGVAAGLVVGSLLMLAFIGSLLAAVLQFVTTGGGGSRTLPPGQMLWQVLRRFRECRGPYRAYDCRLSPELVEGIAASVELSADGLDTETSQACLAPLARARAAAASGQAAAACTAIAEALAVFARSVGPGGAG